MKTFKNSTKDFKEISNIFCNMCGVELKKDSFGYFSPYFDVDYRWSYPSKFDNSIHSFTLCENCYENFIKTFKLPPTTQDL